MSSNLKVNTILPSVGSNIGIGTNGGELNVDGGCKVQVGTALTLGHSTGVQFSTQNLHSTGFEVNQINASGIVTASHFYGNGANLSGITQTTINNNANNRLITGSGTANTLEGEANFTYDGGSNLTLNSTAHDGGFNILAANNNQETRLRLQGKASDGTGHSFYFNAKRSANRLDIATASGACISVMGATRNIGIQNAGPESPLQIGAGTNAVTNKSTVHVAPASGNASLTLRGGSPTIYFDGTGGGHTRLLTDNTDIAISNGNPDSTGNERFRLRADGGLCFNGDTAAANALDDYEEGSWTPTIIRSSAGYSGSYVEQVGVYTKIGRLVHLAFAVDIQSFSGGGGHVGMAGLPFSVGSNGLPGWPHSAHLAMCHLDGEYAGGVDARSIIFTGTNYGYVWNIDDGTWEYGNFSRVKFRGQFTYMV